MDNSLNLIVTEERMEDVDLATYYNLDKSADAPIDFVAHFVMNDDLTGYLPKAEAVAKVLFGRKLRDIKALADQLRAAIDETAVPKE